jgi:hypothetical protein
LNTTFTDFQHTNFWRKFSKRFCQNTCTMKPSSTVYQEDKGYKNYPLKTSGRTPRRILSPLLPLPIVYEWENPFLSYVKFKKRDPQKKIGLTYQNYSLKNILHFIYRNTVLQISLSLWNLRSSHLCSLTLGSFAIWRINMAQYAKDCNIFCNYSK